MMAKLSAALLRLLNHWGFSLPPEVEPRFNRAFRLRTGL